MTALKQLAKETKGLLEQYFGNHSSDSTRIEAFDPWFTIEDESGTEANDIDPTAGFKFTRKPSKPKSNATSREDAPFDDYVRGKFQTSIRLNSVNKDDTHVKIDCHFKIGIKEIENLILDHKASYIIVIDCRDTFHRECFKTTNAEETFYCKASFFSRKFSIESYVIANEEISDFECSHINEDFGIGPFNFEKGSILAQHMTENYFILNEKFQSLQRLIKLSPTEDLAMGEWHFDIYTDRPEIFASPEQCKIFNGMSKPILLNIMLVPIVSEMIKILKKGEEEDLEYPWVQIIQDGFEKKDISLDDFNGDSFRLAQHFLSLPQKDLNKSFIED